MNQNTKPNDLAFASAENQTSGLTKREYFAAQALTGLCARNQMFEESILADLATRAADALIARLNH